MNLQFNYFIISLNIFFWNHLTKFSNSLSLSLPHITFDIMQIQSPIKAWQWEKSKNLKWECSNINLHEDDQDGNKSIHIKNMRRHEGKKVKRFATQSSWESSGKNLNYFCFSPASNCAISLVNKSLTKGVKKGKPVITRRFLYTKRKKVIHQHTAADMIEKLLWNYWHNKSINIIVCGVFYVPFFCVCRTDEIIVKLSNQNIFIASSRSFRHFRLGDEEMMWKLVMSGKGFMMNFLFFYDQLGRLL